MIFPISLLLMRGASIEARDANEDTPLRWAIRRGKLASTTELIKFGASLKNAKDNNYKQANFEKQLEKESMMKAIEEGKRLKEMRPQPGEFLMKQGQ